MVPANCGVVPANFGVVPANFWGLGWCPLILGMVPGVVPQNRFLRVVLTSVQNSVPEKKE